MFVLTLVLFDLMSLSVDCVLGQASCIMMRANYRNVNDQIIAMRCPTHFDRKGMVSRN